MFFEMNIHSNELKCNTQVSVILPNRWEGNTYKTMWLLHGLGDDHTTWMRNTSIERYANQYGIAVIMPGVQRSWYTDTAYEARYFTFITKELPEICNTHFNGMSLRREDNIAAGLSMGGYGALKAALRCPDRYGFCVSLSGSLDISRRGRKTILNEWRGIFDFQMQTPLELSGSESDLFAIATENHDKGILFPNLYMWCGTEDSLLDINEKFHDHLSSLGIRLIIKKHRILSRQPQAIYCNCNSKTSQGMIEHTLGGLFFIV